MFILIPSVKNYSGQDLPGLNQSANTFQSIQQIDSERSGNLKIVQISDFIKHSVYQDYYQYGIDEFLPVPGQEITVDRFSEDNGSVTEEKEILFIFTDSYYSDILHSIPENSAAGIFTDGAEIYRISYLPAYGSLFMFFEWWQYLITVLFTVIPIIIFYFTIKPVYLSRVFIVFTRRNRQSA